MYAYLYGACNLSGPRVSMTLARHSSVHVAASCAEHFHKSMVHCLSLNVLWYISHLTRQNLQIFLPYCTVMNTHPQNRCPNITFSFLLFKLSHGIIMPRNNSAFVMPIWKLQQLATTDKPCKSNYTGIFTLMKCTCNNAA